MRILLLSQWFDPEPCFKGLQFAKALQSRGHEVTVLTGFPNYPGGKVYPGYRIRPWQQELVEGVPILRVPLFPSHSRSAPGRVANYVSFAVSAAFIGLCLCRPAEVVYVYHPPATVGLPALVFRLVWGARTVYDIQDLWPDTLAATGMLKSLLIQRVVGWWCALIYRATTRIVVLSPGFKRRLVERGVPPDKIEVIYNWTDERNQGGAFGQLPANEAALVENRFNVLFAGNLGVAQGLDTVLATARILERTHPNVLFLFVGDGIERPRLERLAAEQQLGNVTFLPRRTSRELEALYAEADVLLVHLRDYELFMITIPSKTQAYLLVGRPIIMAVRGDAASLIEASGAGVTCEPENPSQLALAVSHLASLSAERRAEMGAAGRTFYATHMSLRHGVESFARLFEESVGGQRPIVV